MRTLSSVRSEKFPAPFNDVKKLVWMISAWYVRKNNSSFILCYATYSIYVWAEIM